MLADNCCLKCGEVLFDTVTLDARGTKAMRVGRAVRPKRDGPDMVIICKKCKAKNVLVRTPGGDKPGGLRISHLRP